MNDLKSFDHLWAIKLNLAHLLLDNSVHNHNNNRITKYTCITSVPTGTHQFPAENHHLEGLRYTVKYHTPKFSYRQQSLCHSVTTIPNFGIRCPQRTTLSSLRNLFEPKSYDTNTMPKWQSSYIPIISNTQMVLISDYYNGDMVTLPEWEVG